MKLKILITLTLTVLIFESCCPSMIDGKSCPESDNVGLQPSILINFKNYPTAGFRVMLYILENNTTIDSIPTAVDKSGNYGISPYKKARGGDIEEVKLKKFIIYRNNKSDTISQLNCTYKERVKNCTAGCDQYTSGEYTNFTFLYKNQVSSVSSLTLDY